MKSESHWIPACQAVAEGVIPAKAGIQRRLRLIK
jgi:hypothetical protein